jgi:hypothetical protein
MGCEGVKLSLRRSTLLNKYKQNDLEIYFLGKNIVPTGIKFLP